MYVKTLVVVPGRQYTIVTSFGSFCAFNVEGLWELHTLSARLQGPSDETYIATFTDLQDIRYSLSQSHPEVADAH